MAIDRTAFHALVDDDGSNTVGSLWNKHAIQTVLLDPIDAALAVQAGAWQSYAALWGGSDGVAPVLGNGLLSGRYVLTGKWVDVAIVLQMGSTTTYGTSSYWLFTIPFVPRIFGTAGQEVSFRSGAMTSAGGAQPGLIAYFLTGASLYVITTSGALVNPTTPFTWSAGAVLSVRGSYELP